MKNNNRILIRRFKNDDRVDIFKCIYHDKKVQKFYFAPYMKKPIELNMRVLMNEEKLIFAIVHIRKNRVIGIINEQKNKADLEEIELGYAIGSRYWKKGYMTEALKLAIDYIFENTNYKKIVCGFIEGNNASKRVLEKCGFNYVCSVKNDVKFNDVYYDTQYYRLDKGR